MQVFNGGESTLLLTATPPLANTRALVDLFIGEPARAIPVSTTLELEGGTCQLLELDAGQMGDQATGWPGGWALFRRAAGNGPCGRVGRGG